MQGFKFGVSDLVVVDVGVAAYGLGLSVEALGARERLLGLSGLRFRV